MSCKHFAHFIAVFNCAIKHRKQSFTFALRRKKILLFLDFLISRNFISGYTLPAGMTKESIPDKLGGMRSPYYVPVTVSIRNSRLLAGIKIGSTAGNRRSMRKEEIFVENRRCGNGENILIFLSDRFRGFCTISDLANAGSGGILVCRLRLQFLRDIY